MATAQLKGTVQREYGVHSQTRPPQIGTACHHQASGRGTWGAGEGVPGAPSRDRQLDPAPAGSEGNRGRALPSPLPPANCAPEKGALPRKVCFLESGCFCHHEVLSAFRECAATCTPTGPCRAVSDEHGGEL